MKVSKKDLESGIVEMNRWAESTVGENEFSLDHNDGGYRVFRRMGKGRGMADISPRLSTKKLMNAWMDAYLDGIGLGWRLAKASPLPDPENFV